MKQFASLLRIKDTENDSESSSHEESWGTARDVGPTISLLYEGESTMLPFETGQQLDCVATLVIHQVGDEAAKRKVSSFLLPL